MPRLFSSDGFVPRRVCGLWPDWLVWEHVAGNALVWLAYVAMPVMIWRLGVRAAGVVPVPGRRPLAFALFIGLCGLGHFLDMLAFFRPMYRLSGHVLVATGLVSCWTAWSLRRAWPALMAMRSPAELERVDRRADGGAARAIDELRLAEVDRAYLATIVESSDDAIIGKDLDGVVTSWNAGAERLFGYTAAEAIGRPIAFLIPPDRRDEEPAILRAAPARRGGGPLRVGPAGQGRPVDRRLPDASRRSGTVRADRRRLEDRPRHHRAEAGGGRRSAGSTRSWNARIRERTAELAAAKEAAEAATRAKSEFLANMSHEIRTPMNGVIGMTELLLDTQLNDLQRGYAETIRGSGEALLTVINDILDFSKIEAGKLTLEVADFDLRTLMEEVADLLAPGAHQKGLEIHCRVARRSPAGSVGDPVRIRQVLTNLVGNAVKFTDRGEVDLEARLRRRGRGRVDAPDPRPGHRHRHPGGPPGRHLRELHADRGRKQPAVRRDRARAGDLPEPRRPDGRADRPGEPARRGEHLLVRADPRPGRPARRTRRPPGSTGSACWSSTTRRRTG